MLHGKVKAAIRWATERTRGVVLSPSDLLDDSSTTTVMDILRQKHPPPSSDFVSLLKCDPLPQLEDVEITGSHILCSARRIQGGAGPGGCDSCHWRDVLLRYGAHSARLRDAVAALSRRLANTIFPWNDIRALVSNRLIALDKCPGVRPIGIGETLRRIIGKAICSATRGDIESLCGADQLCGGVKSGIEGAIHAMNEMYSQNCTSDDLGILLVDASNAFNSLDRAALLWNARILWPRCSRFLFNTYSGWAALVVHGSEEFLYSREGVTQGDPLSMFLYAVGTMPLIRLLKNPSLWTQIWYADDASACGKLSHIRRWFDLLLEVGPGFGYYPNPRKCSIVVGSTSRSAAEHLFGSLGVEVVCDHRFLGGFLGGASARDAFVLAKVDQWVSDIHHLSHMAESQPQAAYAALTKSLQREWIFLQRVVPMCCTLFANLETTLLSSFFPAMFGCEISSLEQRMFSLPVRFGGLGVDLPVTSADSMYAASRHATGILMDAIIAGSPLEPCVHEDLILVAQRHHWKQLNTRYDALFSTLCLELDPLRSRALQHSRDNDLSAWLTVMPIERDNYDLTAQEFRDALAVRYKKPLLSIPPHCDGCGAPSSLDHFLICKKGGLIVQRHNEIRDAIGDLAALLWNQVKREPVVADDCTDGETLIADLGVRGVWSPQSEALFDIRIIDTDAQSYLTTAPNLVLFRAEGEKKQKYSAAATARRAHFTPLCFSVDGLAGSEAVCFLRRLAGGLSSRWDRTYSEVLCWIRTRLAFAILRATGLCVRGSRSKWRCLGLEDGAAIDHLT